ALGMEVEPLSQYSVIFYAITLAGAIYALFAQFVQKKFGNPQRVKEIQKEMQEINKRYAEALKSKDDSKLKKADADQRRIPALMTESMKFQFIPLLVLLPVLFVLPNLLRGQFPVFEVELPFPVPLFPLHFLQHFNFDGFPNFRTVFGSYGYFWVAVFFIGILAQGALWIYGKAKKSFGHSGD
ncbi:MAG: EMC3/TMCO1 family protein, partial [Acidobacteriota bacterium]